VTVEGIAISDTAPSIWKNDRGNLSLLIDEGIFSKEAALRTAYKFTGACHVWLESGRDPGRYVVCLRPKGRDVDLGRLAGEFSNELIDQQLRRTLDQQFGELRTIITAQAFSEGNLLEPEPDPR
jgi:His-Xaa-Ser system protein HxsD